jgi:hypothetical protein
MVPDVPEDKIDWSSPPVKSIASMASCLDCSGDDFGRAVLCDDAGGSRKESTQRTIPVSMIDPQ